MNVGQSFSPLNQDAPGQGGTRGGTTSPVQDAIKILSLRLPTNVGGSGVIAGAPGAMGAQAGNPLVENLLRALFGGGGAPTGQVMNLGGGLPGQDTPPMPQTPFGAPTDQMPTAPTSGAQFRPSVQFPQARPSPDESLYPQQPEAAVDPGNSPRSPDFRSWLHGPGAGGFGIRG